MKLVIYQRGGQPIEIETEQVRVMVGEDHFVMCEQAGNAREGSGLLVRLEEHDGFLATDLAVFPDGANSVRLKGGLR